uniref:Rab-GAP TBC domain-containing protein n=1 Tax=Globodera pallida TaxID=36090 RepID=A0A183BSZ9_GLOPA
MLSKPLVNRLLTNVSSYVTKSALIEKRPNKVVGLWLMGCAGMVYGAITIGGLTRLTESGLSMVKWDIFRTMKPPFTQAEWEKEFSNYKQYPEYQFKSSDTEMTLAQFKFIWAMEYLHRMWGRAVGIVFLLPCAYFWCRGYFNRSMKTRMSLSGLLIVSQHSNSPSIKSFRGMVHGNKLAIFLTVLIGAFVAGLDAGLVYNSWPKYAAQWIPEGLLFYEPIWRNFVENPVTVQFLHRNMAYLTLLLVTVTWARGIRIPMGPRTRLALHSLLVAAWLQVALGIWTLNVPFPGSVKPVYGAQFPPLQSSTESGDSPTKTDKKFKNYEKSVSDVWDPGVPVDDSLVLSAAAKVLERHAAGQQTNDPATGGTTHFNQRHNDVMTVHYPTVPSRHSKIQAMQRLATQRVQFECSDGDVSRLHRLRRILGLSSVGSDGKRPAQGTVVDLDELRKECWLGIPHRIRPLAWRLLSDYIPTSLDRREMTLNRKRDEYWHYVEQYFHTRYDEQHQITFRQIHIDIPRMCPLIPLFQQKKVQEIFERVLYIWAIRHPASGYVQGINDLVTPFFIVFLSEFIPDEMDMGTFDLAHLSREQVEIVEADSFWCVSALLDTIQDNYTFAQPGIQRKVSHLKELVHPASGYVQGINDLVTPFFIVFLSEFIPDEMDMGTFDLAHLSREQVEIVEADSFWCVSALLDTIQDNYTFAQPGIQRKVSHLKELVSRVEPILHSHFETNGVEFLQFSFRWMNNLLMREIPLRATIRLWDTYLSERDGFSQFHTYICGAFLRLWSKQLLNERDFQV